MAYLQQRGFGVYDKTGDWSWEFYPPPYDFLAPRNAASLPAPILLVPGRGLSGCGCGGACGGCGGDAHGGLGLFDSGLDVTGWGLPEYGIAVVGLYTLVHLLSDTKRVVTGVSKSRRSRKARAARKKRLQEELASL